MGKIEILSLNVGKPKIVLHRNKEVSTGIYKDPTSETLFLSYKNFEKDGQADLVHHGGKEKAVCVYPYEHYAFWESVLEREIAYGAFGENLTIQGLTETETHIGDVFQLGEAVVQVSQPRQPCFKLAVKYGVKEMPVLMQESGYTGFYFRVLKEGLVNMHDGLQRIFCHPKGVSVAEANRIMHRDKTDIYHIQKILEVEELSVNWRNTFTKRLKGQEVDSSARLTGGLNG